MKKFILPISAVLLPFVLILTLATTVSNAAPNLSGTWSMGGDPFEGKQTDNSITIIGKDPAKPAFTGTISGNTVGGSQYLIAKGCPNLDKYVPASGTISEDGTTITVTYTSPQFDQAGCFDLAGTEREHTLSYTKTISAVITPLVVPSPTPSPKEIEPTEALIKNAPTADDLSIDQNAKDINDWIDNVLGPFDSSNISPNPPDQRTKPAVVHDPNTNEKKNYYRLSSNPSDPLIYLSTTSLTKVSLTTPDGINISPQDGDYLRVPFGTRIKVDYGSRDEDYAGIWISGSGPDAYLYVKNGEIELVAPEPGRAPWVKTEIEVKDQYTNMRWGWAGDTPHIPKEIKFEGQPQVTISSKGTDFGFSYDPASKKIAVEIYDGKLVVKVKGKEKILASKYGQPISRLEIDQDGTSIERVAIPKSEWEKTHPSPKPPAEVTLTVKETKVNVYLLPALAGLLLLVAAGGFWYRKKKGQLPWEDKIKEFVSKLKNRK